MLVQGDVNESTCSYITPTFMCVSHARAKGRILTPGVPEGLLVSRVNSSVAVPLNKASTENEPLCEASSKLFFILYFIRIHSV